MPISPIPNFAHELFECVWSFCGIGAWRVKFSYFINRTQLIDILYELEDSGIEIYADCWRHNSIRFDASEIDTVISESQIIVGKFDSNHMKASTEKSHLFKSSNFRKCQFLCSVNRNSVTETWSLTFGIVCRLFQLPSFGHPHLFIFFPNPQSLTKLFLTTSP